jgi:hypothetical protein
MHTIVVILGTNAWRVEAGSLSARKKDTEDAAWCKIGEARLTFDEFRFTPV